MALRMNHLPSALEELVTLFFKYEDSPLELEDLHIPEAHKAQNTESLTNPTIKSPLYYSLRTRLKWAVAFVILLSIGSWAFLSGGLFSRQRKPSRCNPFEQLGYLHVNLTDPADNIWRPYNEECPASALFGTLLNTLHGSKPLNGDKDDLSWMRNRTVAMIGDSVDRYIVLAFCKLIGSIEDPIQTHEKPADLSAAPLTPRYIKVSARSALLPPTYYYDGKNISTPPDEWPKDRIHDFVRDAQLRIDTARDTSGPQACYLPTHDFMIVQTSSYGLNPPRGGELFWPHDSMDPPYKMVDRFEHLLKPTLANLARHFRRPSTINPDIVQVISGFWDLKAWSLEDFQAVNEQPNEKSNTPFSDLSPTRLMRWQKELVITLRGLAKAFPDPSIRILWRTYSRPNRYWPVPFSRVTQLGELVLYTLKDLMEHDSLVGPRLRINYWGHRFLGQEYHLLDPLHPNTLPGAVLWADTILWELRELVEGGSRH
ncbi:hypothetical protein CROQUDRAFT_85824 [Cronartium quercuum f. sp. fusiforme G11]|uniref:Uncharacterized protein n=1 Tax=Cronartium quercuum f. sp. fusiforme G11 TaxID=708437 RepID=A0A9P6NRM3_9BASI|nr:hypothetical protein CROQUDRAFT_85824 [Cronartium quercuum f. sp. fusiforme G11]